MASIVKIDHEECIGCEACVEECPAVFEFNEDEAKAYVIAGADPNLACVDDAIASCPVDCIEKE